MKDNYKALAAKIKTKGADLEKLEKAIESHQRNGTISTKEFRLLDLMIFNRQVKTPAYMKRQIERI